VPRSPIRPTEELINQWPEAFENLYMDTIPVAYIDYILIEFYDETIWELSIQDQIKATDDFDRVAEVILETIKDCKPDIKNLAVKLNLDKLKNDIQNSTKNIL